MRRGKTRGIYSEHGWDHGHLRGGLEAQGHHCFKDIFKEPSACMIQERRWWEVGRFSQLGLQRCMVAGSHAQESPCGSGQESRQQLARMLSRA